MKQIAKINQVFLVFGRSLLNPSKFVGEVIASLVAAAIFAVVSIYVQNGLSWTDFKSSEDAVVGENIHSSLTGRLPFLIVQTISWGILGWPIFKLYRALEDELPALGLFAIFGLLVTVPVSYWFLRIVGWLVFNDKTIFLRDILSNAAFITQ